MIEIIDKYGVGWKNGKRTRQYPGYAPPSLSKAYLNSTWQDFKYDPSSPLHATLHGTSMKIQ